MNPVPYFILQHHRCYYIVLNCNFFLILWDKYLQIPGDKSLICSVWSCVRNVISQLLSVHISQISIRRCGKHYWYWIVIRLLTVETFTGINSRIVNNLTIDALGTLLSLITKKIKYLVAVWHKLVTFHNIVFICLIKSF